MLIVSIMYGCNIIHTWTHILYIMYTKTKNAVSAHIYTYTCIHTCIHTMQPPHHHQVVARLRAHRNQALPESRILTHIHTYIHIYMHTRTRSWTHHSWHKDFVTRVRDLDCRAPYFGAPCWESWEPGLHPSLVFVPPPPESSRVVVFVCFSTKLPLETWAGFVKIARFVATWKLVLGQHLHS